MEFKDLQAAMIAAMKAKDKERKVSHGGFFRDRYKEEKLADGGIRYSVDGVYNEDAEDGTDFRALVDKYISIGVATNIS